MRNGIAVGSGAGQYKISLIKFIDPHIISSHPSSSFKPKFSPPMNSSRSVPSGNNTHFDAVVVGAGVGGVSAAVAAARQGAETLLIDRLNTIGGTGVHSPLALICTYWDNRKRIINDGLHREFFPQIVPVTGHCKTYDERELLANYERAIQGEPTLTVWTGTTVVAAERRANRIIALRTSGRRTARVTASVWVDSSANGDLSALATCEFQLGRKGDGHMQPATLTFTVGGLDPNHLPPRALENGPGLWKLWEELQPYFSELKASGRTSNTREDILCFPYPDGKRLLFNQTRVLGVDPTSPESLDRARAEGEKQVDEFISCLRLHPAFRNSVIESISPILGVREGRRIIGDHLLTEQECLGEVRFPDMVAACASCIDIHNPDGAGTHKTAIPGSGYYHIPYRSLIARDVENLLLGSRCISGTHEAHSSYRVMCSICSIGQAAGVAAALAANLTEGMVRKVDSSWIRHELQQAGAFVEGTSEAPIYKNRIRVRGLQEGRRVPV